jgi:hypothetical protein
MRIFQVMREEAGITFIIAAALLLDALAVLVLLR